MGAGKQTKGRVGRRQRRHVPPLGTAAARSAGNQPGKPPAGRVIRAPAPVPPGFSPGDARGEAPCIRKLKISPFPPGRGAGGMGAESKLKAGAAGDKQGKPPLRIPERQGQPTTSRASPPAGRVIRAPAPVPPGFSPGDARGEAPCIRKQKISPFPPGRGAGGMGAELKLKAGAAGDKQGKPPLRIPKRQGQPATSRASPPITPAPHIPPAGRRQCGQNPAGRRDSHRTRARPRRRKWRAERYREHG